MNEELELRGEAREESGCPEDRGDKLREHFSSLCAQAEELRQEFPDFELGEALKDSEFLRLTAPVTGLDLRRAYYALHREDMDRRAAEKAAAAFAKALGTSARQPREGGRGEAAIIRGDYRSMTRQQQAQLKQRIRDAAARGERIYP